MNHNDFQKASSAWSNFLTENLEKYSRQGVVPLYHYTENDSKVMILDPQKAKENSNPHTARDWRTSGIPRVFFYLDPQDKEKFFDNHNLYVAYLPTESIYDLTVDREGFIEQVKGENHGALDYDKLLNKISGHEMVKTQPEMGWRSPWERRKVRRGYDGLLYNVGFNIVISFIPLEAELTEQGSDKTFSFAI